MSAFPLVQRLKDLIRTQGAIPLETFMALANETYYASGDVFGRGGDFITAPEVSQIFGELIGLWSVVVWQVMGTPEVVRLVELGPGRGTLMADVLRAARSDPGFVAALDLHLVERSPFLRCAQQEAIGPWLAERQKRCSWHDDVATVPPGPAIFIANEFLDALPIRQYERLAEGWRLRCIGLADDGETFVFSPGPEDKTETVYRLFSPGREAPPGAILEEAPMAFSIVSVVSRRLVEQGGAALWIDYGYAEDTLGDSLQAVRGHRFASFLTAPGRNDLSAHVNFAALRRSARSAGAKVCGPITQGRFLSGLGAEERARILLGKATSEQGVQISSGVRRLIHPEEMGALFKVFAVIDPALPPPPGFENRP